MWIELHILQNFAPSCLNRDDTNSPKDCVFGGYRRARISSQCIKRATRTRPAFERYAHTRKGKRTWRLLEHLTKALCGELDVEEEVADNIVRPIVAHIDEGLKQDGKTRVGLYLGPDEMERLASDIISAWDDLMGKRTKGGPLAAKAAGDFVDDFDFQTLSADLALFGRMVASKNVKDMNIDAACQVAHAISTHRVDMDMDFYTAIDDLKEDEEPGADMMGTVEFNSSCFYRYALIDLDQLTANLGGDEELARAAVDGFLRASVAAIPTGKQNSMAAQNPPSLVFAVVKDRGAVAPWSLANAFEVPVEVRRDGRLVDESIARLAAYWADLVGMYGDTGVGAAAACRLGEADLGALDGYAVDSAEQVFATVQQALGAGDA